MPPRRICILRCSKPVWHLNHGHSCRKSRNAFVVSGLNEKFCVYAGFRCFLLPLHLNRWRCLLKTCNRKFINELRLIFRVLFRFRCLGHSAACLVDSPFQSASRAYLHSAVFQAWLASEPRAQLLKVLQCICCERFGCRILP